MKAYDPKGGGGTTSLEVRVAPDGEVELVRDFLSLGGTIVNADSMQVYGDLRVITARPSVEEEARAPHRLYGHVDASEIYSTGRWLSDAAAATPLPAALALFATGVGALGFLGWRMKRNLRAAHDARSRRRRFR